MAALGTATLVTVNPPPLREALADLPVVGQELVRLLPEPEVAAAAITTIVITSSGCYPIGGLSKFTTQVEIRYSGLVVGDKITVTLTATSTAPIVRTFTPESPAVQPLISPIVAAFEILANGAPFTITVADSKGGLQVGTGIAPPPCPTLVCNAGNLGGQVFNDYDGNGVQAALENIGVPDVRVAVFDKLNNVYSTTTDVDGLYKFTTIPAGNYPVRVEFTQIPAVYGQGTPIGTSNKSSVQFYTAATCQAFLALLNPADYSEPNPMMAVSRMNRGDPLSAGVVPPFAYSAIASVAGDTRPYQTSMFPALETFSYTLNTADAYLGGQGNTTNFAGIMRRAPSGNIGSIWGLAWSKQRNTLYMSSVLRRYSGYGPLGVGGLYKWDRATNTASGLVDVRSLGIDVGSIASNAARGLTATLVVNYSGESHIFERDNVEAEVGRVGMGDLEASDDGNVLYFTNLYLRTLHS